MDGLDFDSHRINIRFDKQIQILIFIVFSFTKIKYLLLCYSMLRLVSM